MTANPSDSVVVTQADCEVAADLWRDYVARPGEGLVENALRKGDLNGSGYITHTIAKFRTDAQRELVEALEAICNEADNMATTLPRRAIFNEGRATLARVRRESHD